MPKPIEHVSVSTRIEIRHELGRPRAHCRKDPGNCGENSLDVAVRKGRGYETSDLPIRRIIVSADELNRVPVYVILLWKIVEKAVQVVLQTWDKVPDSRTLGWGEMNRHNGKGRPNGALSNTILTDVVVV